MARFEVPGWCVQAFRFPLDPTEDQARAGAAFGARRRLAEAVATLKPISRAWRVTGIGTVGRRCGCFVNGGTPSRTGVYQRRDRRAVVAVLERGKRRWRRCRYVLELANSRSGKRRGTKTRLPRFKKKACDRDRVTFDRSDARRT